MRKFTVDVTQTVEVTLDETKFTPEFFAEYNETITYLGGDDGDIEYALRQHAEHLAWCMPLAAKTSKAVAPLSRDTVLPRKWASRPAS